MVRTNSYWGLIFHFLFFIHLKIKKYFVILVGLAGVAECDYQGCCVAMIIRDVV